MLANSTSLHIFSRVACEAAICVLSVAGCLDFWRLALLVIALGSPHVWRWVWGYVCVGEEGSLELVCVRMSGMGALG